MDLNQKWDWEPRKLPCKVRPETGNPQADDLRLRLREIAERIATSTLKSENGGGEKGSSDDGNSGGGGGREKTTASTSTNKKPRGGRVPKIESDYAIAMTLMKASDDVEVFNRSLLRSSIVKKASEDRERRISEDKLNNNGGGGDKQHRNDKTMKFSQTLPTQSTNTSHTRLKLVPNALNLLETVASHTLTRTEMNINKRYMRVPKSPAKKIMRDLQMERLVGSMSFGVVKNGGGSAGGERGNGNDGDGDSNAHVKKTKNNSSSNSNSIATNDSIALLTALTNNSTPKKPVSEVFKPYQGDTFSSHGNYMDGMVYLSRMPNRSTAEAGGSRGLDMNKMEDFDFIHDDDDDDDDDVFSDVDDKIDDNNAVQKRETRKSRIMKPSSTDNWNQLIKEREVKLTCAKTIMGWAKHASNVDRLLTEGALEAIMRLCKEDDRGIRRACAGCLRFMSGHNTLCKQMVDVGSLPVLAELAQSSRDKVISRDCAIAMLNLTRMQGCEGSLVEDGAVLALMSLMNDNDELAGVCARGLFNLTCVDEGYAYIERVIKSFLGLAAAATIEVKHICASALCNLSDLKNMRLRLVEEGVVQVLGLLARGAEAKTRRVCAIVLQSLASTKSCRQEMVSKGAVQVLYSLSNDNDANTLHYIASAMMRLALDPLNCTRMVNESGVSALCNICMRCPDMPKTTQPCAAAFQVISRQEVTKVTMVSEQCVPALVTLLRNSSDAATLQFCILALCNLLTNEDNHLPVLQQGGVMAIIEACKNEQPGIRESCALALFNLSCGEGTRKPVVSAGAVPAIMIIARMNDIEAQTRCAATLCNFASELFNIARMVDDGVIPTFIELLKTGVPDTVRHCCAALCQLSQNATSCVQIVELGAVPHIVSGLALGDDMTKQSCCSVLSALSFQPACRRDLCTMGALSALVTLSKMDDKDTLLRCALAFANLSCESTVQRIMIDAGVLPILKQLSNSYSEENQIFVAKALANLSCHVGSEQLMIDQDCISNLMMIGMVRSVHETTKQVCAKALQNLLSESSLGKLCDEGLVATISTFSKLNDEPTMRICANMYNFLSKSEYGRSKLVIKKAALFGLLGLLRSKDRTTQVIVGKTICNLLCCIDSQAATVEVGAIDKLERIATLGDADSEKNCAHAFFLICGSDDNREMMINVNATKIIILLARSPNEETRWNAIRVISNLAQYPSTRDDLLKNNAVMALVALTEHAETGNMTQVMIKAVAQSLCNLAMVEEFAGRMVQERVVHALARLCEKVDDDSICTYIANTIRCMATCTETLSMMVKDGAIELLLKLVKNTAMNKNTIQYESVLRDACFACFKFTSNEALCNEVHTRGGLDIIGQGGSYPSCHATAVAATFLLSINHARRTSVASSSCGAMVITLSLIEPESAITQNASQAMFMLSKSEKSRDALVSCGLSAALVKLCKSENSEVRESSSQALKNLSSSGGGDGLEEGTVSALIAMSEGARESSFSTYDASALVVPVIDPIDASNYMLDETMQPSNYITFFTPLIITTVKESGGDAPLSKGPASPVPPEMKGQHVPHTPVVDEEVELKNEVEESLDKVMMFAKMTVPHELELEVNDDDGDDHDDGGERAFEHEVVAKGEVKKGKVSVYASSDVAIKPEVNRNNAPVANEQSSSNHARAASMRGGGGASNVNSQSAKRLASRSGRASPQSPAMPTRVDQPGSNISNNSMSNGNGGPKEKQAKARRRRRSLDTKRKSSAGLYANGGEEGEGFEEQLNSLGLY